MHSRSPRVHVVALLAALALATPLAAQEVVVATPAAVTKPVPRVRGMARFGLEQGGDKVLSFQYEDGSTPDVTAGGGLHLSLGAAYRALQGAAGGLDAQVGVGLKWRTIPPAENQEADWLRFPLEGMLVFRSTRGFGIGAGAAVHLGNALRMSGEVADAELEFESSPGVLVQAEYAWRGAIFDVRYSGMRYRLAGIEGSIDASSIGVGVGLQFGRHGIVR